MIIGLDVGGTHTDVVLLGENGIHRQAKVPTHAHNLLESVRNGIHDVLRGTDPRDIRRAVLSTTLCTNAIVERKLAPVGMIVSGGPGIDPRSFSTGAHYYCVSGSIDHRGREVQPLDVGEIQAIAAKLRKAGLSNIGIASKFSTRNPHHELQIQEILGNDFEYLVLGHRISGNLNFPRRIATTYLNAAVYPIYVKFFQAVGESLNREGLSIPIYVLKADGGTMSLDASLRYPGQTILSGPAASVMGSLPFAPAGEDAMVLDIGGTTTDMAVLIDQAPLLDRLGIEIGHHKTLIRSLRTRPIAVGGDSQVRVVEGELSIGPERLGPAMAYGGPAATPTDAFFVLGKETWGDMEAAQRGIRDIAEQLGLLPREAAERIFDQACRMIIGSAREMIAAINSKPVYTVHELLDGYQVRPRHLMVLGGPALQFAERLATLSDFQVKVVPRWQVANAIGAAMARTTSEVTLFADTERKMAVAPEEDFRQTISSHFNKQDAVELAMGLLREKALREGADLHDLELDVLEEVQFNMVRGFSTAGRNIRVKVQIKPGLIGEHRAILDKLTTPPPADTAPAS